MPQGPLSADGNRELLLALLFRAIASGKQATALKILAKDPSLVTESSLVGGAPYPVLVAAVAAGMDALVPFALLRGASVDSCMGGTSLLATGVRQNSASLVSMALAFGANLTPVVTKDGASDEPLLDIAMQQLVTHCTRALKNAAREGGKQATLAAAIVLMLLDSGAVPAGNLPTSPLPLLCRLNWSGMPPSAEGPGELRLGVLLQELIKRGADVDLRTGGIPVLRLAVGAKNMPAVLGLLKAGANTDKDFLGEDLLVSLSKNSLSDQIPLVSEFVMRNQIARSRAAAAQPGAAPRGPAVVTVSGDLLPEPARFEAFDVL